MDEGRQLSWWFSGCFEAALGCVFECFGVEFQLGLRAVLGGVSAGIWS